MRKAVLVVDMPDSCYNCNFHNYHYCYAVQCSNEDNDCIERYWRDEVPGKLKPDWCPIKKLPEEQINDYCYDMWERGWNTGWNECLKEIVGE